ncbi:MAG: hypothetical protein ACI35W_05000 [Anaeroplasmataceae bacterium]
MNKLNLKIVGIGNISNPCIMINNEIVKYKKNEYNSYEINYQTGSDRVELYICNYLELQNKWWLITYLIFFIISIFGLFLPGYDKRCRCVSSKCILYLKEDSNMKISFNSFNENGNALVFDSDFQYEELSNIYYINKRIKRRTKLLSVLKVLIWIIIIICIVILLKNKL